MILLHCYIVTCHISTFRVSIYRCINSISLIAWLLGFNRYNFSDFIFRLLSACPIFALFYASCPQVYIDECKGNAIF